jgi:hypothetical protein
MAHRYDRLANRLVSLGVEPVTGVGEHYGQFASHPARTVTTTTLLQATEPYPLRWLTPLVTTIRRFSARPAAE